MIYAHSYRDPLGTACGGSHPSTRDFTGADAMLRHVASYGCIAIAPDLSWIPGGFVPGSFDEMRYAIGLRADVLVAYYLHLKALNSPLFAQRLDLSRIVMAGHSTGGPGCVKAGIFLRKTASVSFGLIAPIPLPYLVIPGDKTLVLKGTFDTLQGANPDQNYLLSGPRKTFVTIPGANHFGYTDLCPPNNHAADVGLFDQNGTIPRNAQQLAGAAYLAALMRYYAQGDETARPYLSGEKQILELTNAGAAGIQVISQGLS
jgi:predicted dienelactone hydrolase